MNANGSDQTVRHLNLLAGQDPYWGFEIKFTQWLDDNRIAFVSFGPQRGYLKFYIYSLSTGAVQQIIPVEGNDQGDIYKISWHPARGLAFDRWPMGLQTMTDTGANYQVLEVPREGMQDTPAMPGWRADGNRIAYVKDINGQGSIGVFDLPSGRIAIDQSTTRDIWPVWNPVDPTKLAFVVKQGGSPQEGDLWLMTMTEQSNTISFSGFVRTVPQWPSIDGSQPVAGATVNAFNAATKELIATAQTDTQGAFTITGIPAATTFYLRVPPVSSPPSSYVPVLSKFMNRTENIQALRPFGLFTEQQLAAFANSPGTGMIIGRVVLKDNPTTFLAGATIVAREWLNGAPTQTTYPVTYTSGAATQADGIYMVKSVPHEKRVQLTATLAGHTFEFNDAVVPVQSGFISQESFFAIPAQQPVTFTGFLRNLSGAPISGGVVALDGTPAITTNTASDGSFTLTGLPAGSEFTVKLTKPPGDQTNYLPVYTRVFTGEAGTTITAAGPFYLYTQEELINLGVASGRGVIHGRVLNSANLQAGYISGAVVTYTSQQGKTTYRVKYQNDAGALVDGPGTFANGMYVILDVAEGDRVTVSAARSDYTFTPRDFITRDNALSQGLIPGQAVAGRVAVGGYIMDTANPAAGIGGALIEQAGAASPPNATVSNANGYWYLTLPASTAFHLKFSKASDATLARTATGHMTFSGNNTNIGEFNLFPLSRLGPGSGNWNLDSGKGIIRARVQDHNRSSLSGAVVTYQSAKYPSTQPYQICYSDDCTNTTSTTSDGRYLIKNVEEGDTVVVTATKSGYTFTPRTFSTYGGTVHQGGITALPPSDDAAIRDGFANAFAAFNSGNVAGFMAFVSAYYLNEGQTRAAFQNEIAGMISAGGKLAYVLGAISIQGDRATVPVTVTLTFPTGQEVDQMTFILRKEGTSWLIYGNQARHGVKVVSQRWANGYHASFIVDDHPEITAVTVSGTGITGTRNLTWQAGGGWSIQVDPPFLGTTIPPTLPTYTITVYEGTPSYTYNRQITGYVQHFATNLSPTGQAGGPVIFTWTGIPGAAEYSVQLSDTNYNRLWNKYDIPPTRTWAGYDGAALEARKTYRYWIVAEDADENASFAEGQFTYTGTAGVSFTQQVTTAAGAALQGVSVTIDGNPNPAPSALTDGSGNFTLSGAPAGSWFALKMAKEGYRPTYTPLLKSQSNFGGGPAFALLTPTDTESWGVQFDTKGVIATRVVDAAGNNIAGAVVTAYGSLRPGVPYIVTYRDDAGNFGGSSTYANGRFFVLNVDEGDIVTVTATKSGYGSQSRSYLTRKGGISQGRIILTSGFSEDFSAPSLDSSWQVNPGIGRYSLTDNSGHLRYYLDGDRAYSGSALGVVSNWSPSLTLIRPFSGDNWVLRTKAHYNIKWYMTGAQYQVMYIAFGEGNGNYLRINRGTDQWYNANVLDAQLVVNGQEVASNNAMRAPDDVVVAEWLRRPYWYEITRNGQCVTLRYSYDGVNYLTAFSAALPAGVTAAQRVIIDGNVWTTAGSYVDWDYINVNPTAIPLRGDLNGDAKVDLVDAILALRALAGMDSTGIRNDYATCGADVNCDGQIGVAEAIYIMQHLGGLRQ